MVPEGNWTLLSLRWTHVKCDDLFDTKAKAERLDCDVCKQEQTKGQVSREPQNVMNLDSSNLASMQCADVQRASLVPTIEHTVLIHRLVTLAKNCQSLDMFDGLLVYSPVFEYDTFAHIHDHRSGVTVQMPESDAG